MAEPTGVVKTWLSKAEAGEAPEHGQAWDEITQSWMPRGELFELARYRKDAEPETMLAQFDQRRAMVLRFVGSKMIEAEYDGKGYLVEGKLHHCYVVPGSTKKALTKTGAELLAELFRLRRGTSKVMSSVETADYVSARVHCELFDQYGRAAGAHEAAASTAEPSFRSPMARKKYGAQGRWEGPKGHGKWVETGGPDFRAALNDVVARAGKRAFVGAVIVATATDEIFEVADAENQRRKVDVDEKAAQATAERQTSETTRQQPLARPSSLTIGGVPLNAMTTADLEKAAASLKTMPDHRWDKHRDAVDVELEQRRVDATFPGALDEDQDDLQLGAA